MESDPQAGPLQPDPVSAQVTAVLDVPVTVAVNDCVLEVLMEALVGLRLSSTATAATMVMLAEADLVGSAALVAFTVTVAGEGAVAGAVYSPPEEMLPHEAPAQPAPERVQVTAVLEELVTVAANG